MYKYCQKQLWWQWKQWLQKFAKTFQSGMIDVEAYMAFSLKSFNAKNSFNLLQFLQKKKMMYVETYIVFKTFTCQFYKIVAKFFIPCLPDIVWCIKRRCFLVIVNYQANPHTWYSSIFTYINWKYKLKM